MSQANSIPAASNPVGPYLARAPGATPKPKLLDPLRQSLRSRHYSRRTEETYCHWFFLSEQVLEYLGRYTHRVALSNDRLVRLEGNQVTFRWRDSADGNKIKGKSLEVFEFIRRFFLHLLPDQFIKIRHYGLLSNRSRKGKLLRCQKFLGVSTKEETEESPKETWQDLLTRITGIDPRVCPFCGQGKMVEKEILPACAISTADRMAQYAGCPP